MKVRDIAMLITEDIDTINEDMLGQSQEFWAMLADMEPSLAPLAERQDLDSLMRMYKGHEEGLADFAESEGFNLIAMQIRQRAGIGGDEGDWEGGSGMAMGPGDFAGDPTAHHSWR